MHKSRKKYLVIGHSLIDSRCYLKEFPRVDSLEVLLKPIKNSCGGSAANVSYNLSKMGLKVKICSAIGNDRAGKFIVHSLKEDGVDISGLRRFKGESGKAIVLIDQAGNVKVLESIGVSDHFFKARDSDFKGIKHLHMTGMNLKTLLSYSREAKKRAISISADLGRSKIAMGKEKIEPILKRVNILLMNKHELELLTKNKIKSIKEEKEVIKQLHEEYGFTIAVKGGSKESIAYDGNLLYVKKPIKVKVVDTIGAGDAFDSAFIAMQKEKGILRDSFEFALKIASLKVQRLGAQALPSRKVVRKLFNKYLKK